MHERNVLFQRKAGPSVIKWILIQAQGFPANIKIVHLSLSFIFLSGCQHLLYDHAEPNLLPNTQSGEIYVYQAMYIMIGKKKVWEQSKNCIKYFMKTKSTVQN